MGLGAGYLTVGSEAEKGSSGPKKGRAWVGHLSPLRIKNGGYMAQKLGWLEG